MKIIGIFGGTFDPVHFGHLRPVQEVCQNLSLDEVRWIPCGMPPHRGFPQVSVEHRLAMMKLALQDNVKFIADDRETKCDGPSYTVNTLESLREDFPDDSLVLILGQDAFNGLPEWHRWRDLLNLAHIVVCTRPGSELASSGQLIEWMSDKCIQDAKQLSTKSAGFIYKHDVTQLPISATQIRQLYLQGESPQYLLPNAVNEYIHTNGLYR